MIDRSPAATINWCVHEAMEHDLPAVLFPAREIRNYVSPERVLRPGSIDASIEVHSWDQSWSDTSLGMGGVAGQAISSARTTVVIDTSYGYACVYVGRFLRGRVEATPDFFLRVQTRDVIHKRFPIGTAVALDPRGLPIVRSDSTETE